MHANTNDDNKTCYYVLKGVCVPDVFMNPDTKMQYYKNNMTKTDLRLILSQDCQVGVKNCSSISVQIGLMVLMSQKIKCHNHLDHSFKPKIHTPHNVILYAEYR